MNTIAIVDFSTYPESVPEVLDAAGAKDFLCTQERVLIKPNLINDSPPPITTSVRCVEAIVMYVRECSRAQVVIGEGVGAPGLNTHEAFDRLGYTEMAKRWGVELIDLNNAKTICLCWHRKIISHNHRKKISHYFQGKKCSASVAGAFPRACH